MRSMKTPRTALLRPKISSTGLRTSLILLIDFLIAKADNPLIPAWSPAPSGRDLKMSRMLVKVRQINFQMNQQQGVQHSFQEGSLSYEQY
jgi:hypothetical protein